MVRRGEFGRMAATVGARITSVPLSDAVEVKGVDLALLDIARRFYS